MTLDSDWGYKHFGVSMKQLITALREARSCEWEMEPLQDIEVDWLNVEDPEEFRKQWLQFI